jgi:hypothetical protein
MDIIDELAKANPFWGGVALRVLCNTIGYSAVNTILWDYRKRNQVPTITSTIDWFNDEMAEKQATSRERRELRRAGPQQAQVRGWAQDDRPVQVPVHARDPER